MFLETQRLILRKPEITHVDDYLSFVNSDFVQQFNAMTTVTREKAEFQFSNTQDDCSAIAIELKQTGRLIGMIYTQEDSLRYEVASKELSYFLREEEAHKGYMKEALHALIGHLFKTENLTCIAARSFVPNIASQRLLESLGFRKNGVIPKCVKGYQGQIFDDCLYSLMKEDYHF